MANQQLLIDSLSEVVEYIDVYRRPWQPRKHLLVSARKRSENDIEDQLLSISFYDTGNFERNF